MRVLDAMLQVISNDGEILIYLGPDADAKKAESARVNAFSTRRRQIPQGLAESIGIQKTLIKDEWFLRIYKRDTAEGQAFVRDPATGELIPIKENKVVPPLKVSSSRMLSEMLEQGLTESEIIAILATRGESKESVINEIAIYNASKTEKASEINQ